MNISNSLFTALAAMVSLGAVVPCMAGPGMHPATTHTYLAVAPGGIERDGQASIIYDPNTGEVAVDAPARLDLTSINLDSSAGIFTGDPALNLGGTFDYDSDHNIFKAVFGSSFGSLSFGNVAQRGLSEPFVLKDLSVVGSLAAGGDLGNVDLIYAGEYIPLLQPGDANQDLDVNQMDLVQVLTAGKYVTGQSATWGQGDWDDAPGGVRGAPPLGNGLFDEFDIMAALGANVFGKGPYGAIRPGGVSSDAQASIIYDARTGDLAVDAPGGEPMTSIHIVSRAGIFSGEDAQNLGGSFDNDTDENIFKATFGSSFGSIRFGNVAQSGLTREFLLNDLTIVGSLHGGGGLGDVDLVYIPLPEPATITSLLLGLLVVLGLRRFRACEFFSAYAPIVLHKWNCVQIRRKSLKLPSSKSPLPQTVAGGAETNGTRARGNSSEERGLIYCRIAFARIRGLTEMCKTTRPYAGTRVGHHDRLAATHVSRVYSMTWTIRWYGPRIRLAIVGAVAVLVCVMTQRWALAQGNVKLRSGDSDQDLDFDQFDLIQVQQAAKYLTGRSATWGEGDWNGGPGGVVGIPPTGDGRFDQLDIISALVAGIYFSGAYAPRGRELGSSIPIVCCGVPGDGQTSLIYDPDNGRLSVDAPVGSELTTINVDSVSGIFTGDTAQSLGGSFDNDADTNIFKATFGSSFGSISFGNVARRGLGFQFLLDDLSVIGSLAGGGGLGEVDLVHLGPLEPFLMPGDANQDLKFDQQDVVQVLTAGKYVTGKFATWSEGDWNGAPGGEPGNPPPGDGLFDEFDIIAALGGNVFGVGQYFAIESGGQRGDDQTSIIYDANSGELLVDAPRGTELTSINIQSAAGVFTGNSAVNLGGSFDNDSDMNIFKATFGSSFGTLSFGNVAQPGLSEAFVWSDLMVIGSLAGGGGLGEVDLIYVPIPEPSTVALLVTGLFGLLVLARMNRVTQPSRNSLHPSWTAPLWAQRPRFK